MTDPTPVRDGSEILDNVPLAGLGVLDGFRLEGRTALVTGGGRGIGRAIALAFAEVGASVAVAARSASQLDEVVTEIEARGGRALALPLDVTDAAATTSAAQRVVDELGPIDILVNNAGNIIYKPFVPLPGVPTDVTPQFAGPTSEAEWRAVLDTHTTSAFHLLRALAPAMLERRRGRVINVLSNSIQRHVPFVSSYDVAKAALGGLTQSLAYEWGRYGITVNAIAPGHFHTALSAEMHETPEPRRKMLKRIPLRREGDLREVAALAVYLASDWAAFVTGQVVTIDGGEVL